MAEGTIRVEGLRELNRAFAKANKDSRREFRSIERSIALPIKEDAEQLAVARISGLRRTRGVPAWSVMRIGVTQNLVYVAPRERGRRSKTHPAVRRPNLKDLLLDKAMVPALNQNAATTEAAFGRALDRMADRWGN